MNNLDKYITLSISSSLRKDVYIIHPQPSFMNQRLNWYLFELNIKLSL